ncbi:hypothetical protein PLUTE_b0735 [Pseudoalteromonas luteoviolacea DSM 6061]|nr:hypothetical protein [Pseudoalteromonas luteoviolacea DSM 6061]
MIVYSQRARILTVMVNDNNSHLRLIKVAKVKVCYKFWVM